MSEVTVEVGARSMEKRHRPHRGQRYKEPIDHAAVVAYSSRIGRTTIELVRRCGRCDFEPGAS